MEIYKIIKAKKYNLIDMKLERIIIEREKICRNICFLMKHNFFSIYVDETAIDEKLFQLGGYNYKGK